MAFRPKLSEVSDELRERAALIRQLGIVGLFAVFILLFAILLIDITSGFLLPNYMDFSTPRWGAVPIVIFIGVICDILAIALRRMGTRLQADARFDPAAEQIGKSAALFGGIGVALIFIGPFVFGWLLLGVGTH